MLRRRTFIGGLLSSATLLGCQGTAPVAAVRGGLRHTPLTLRPAEERGQASRSWLEARYSFSFSRYRDPAHMGFRSLRVMNEDRIAAGGGFPMHSHQNMEIVTYVLEGLLEHQDSLGNGGIIRPGLVQQMSAGSGIRHSEFNPSASQPTHMLQIWFRPDQSNHVPRYAQQHFSRETRQGQRRLIVSGDPGDGVVTINQDARMYASVLRAGQSIQHDVLPSRHAWIQVAQGRVIVNGTSMKAGDGAHGSEAGQITVRAQEDAELLIFDLA